MMNVSFQLNKGENSVSLAVSIGVYNFTLKRKQVI